MSCEIPFSPENSDLVEICEMKKIDIYVDFVAIDFQKFEIK